MRYDAGFYVELEVSAGVWADITEDVLDSAATASYGIRGNGPSERIAGTGQMFFELNNSQSNSAGMIGYYSPGRYGSRPGFTEGARVRARFRYGGEDWYKFLGRIPKGGIKAAAGIWDSRRVTVEVRDWMEQAATYEIRGQAVQTGLRADQALQVLIEEMPEKLQPENLSLEVGQDSFETVFDKAKAGSVLMSEAARLVASELGYLYIKRNQTDGETLVMENRFTRYLKTRTEIPNGSGTSVYDSDFEELRDLQAEYGQQLYNRVRGRVYPRTVDVTVRTLAQLQSSLFVAAGASETVQISYRDPDNKATNVSGINMEPPAAEDWSFNLYKNGEGTDLSGDLSVSAVYNASYVEVTFTNHGAQGGYVTQYQARGYGIYTYDTVEQVVENESVEILGPEVLNLDMPYQVDPIKAKVFSAYYLNEYGSGFAGFQWVELVANVSDKHMMAFLTIEPGDRIGLREAVTGVEHDFFVNGCEWSVQTGIIRFRWYVARTSDSADNWAKYDESVYDDAAEGYAI